MLFPVHKLTEKQRTAWRMRYQYGWRMKQIAIAMGTSENGASKILRRARDRLKLPNTRVSVIRSKPRTIRSYRFSEVREEF